MKINEVIKELEKIREEKGNIEVNVLSNHYFVREIIKIETYINEYNDEFSVVLEPKE